MNHLAPKTFGEFFHVVKAERNVASVVGDVGSAKEVVPDAEGEAVVHAVAMLGREVASMMPNVHFGVIEKVFEGAKWETEIGVIEVTNDGGRNVHNDEVVDAEANESEGDILKGVIDYIFYPVVAEMCSKAHLLDGVVDFVEFPQPRHAVEKAVHVPLNEVARNEEKK